MVGQLRSSGKRAGRSPAQRAPWAVPAAVVAGGMCGASTRFALGLMCSGPPTGFPWRALGFEVAGYALMGAVLVLVNDVWTERWLVRPFVSVGVLSGFTVCSTYLVDLRRMTHASVVAAALAYLVWTVVVAVLPACCGMSAARRALSWWCGDH